MGEGCKTSALHRQLRVAKSERNCLPQEGVYQLVIQHQVVRHETIHRIYFVQTDQVIFRNIYVYSYTYVPAATINEESGDEFERE